MSSKVSAPAIAETPVAVTDDHYWDLANLPMFDDRGSSSEIQESSPISPSDTSPPEATEPPSTSSPVHDDTGASDVVVPALSHVPITSSQS